MFARLLLGNGKPEPQVRAQLEAEGLVLVEENLRGAVRYHRFKAPGRYHDGKLQPQRLALGISESRFVVYCRSGKVELMNAAFDQPNLSALAVTPEGRKARAAGRLRPARADRDLGRGSDPHEDAERGCDRRGAAGADPD